VIREKKEEREIRILEHSEVRGHKEDANAGTTSLKIKNGKIIESENDPPIA